MILGQSRTPRKLTEFPNWNFLTVDVHPTRAWSLPQYQHQHAHQHHTGVESADVFGLAYCDPGAYVIKSLV